MSFFKKLDRFVFKKKRPTLNDSWEAAGDRDEMDLAKFSEFVARNFHQGLTYLDIGAHAGRYVDAVLINTKNDSSRIYAYEANPNLCKQLALNFPMITISNVAISDKVGSANFNICNYDGLSGLLMRKNGLPIGAVYEEIEVPTATLDSLELQSGVDLIKIDVEGSELEVLAGGINIIKKYGPTLLVEHGPTEDTISASHTEALYDLIVKMKYDVYTIDGFKILNLESWLNVYFNQSVWNYWLIPSTKQMNFQ